MPARFARYIIPSLSPSPLARLDAWIAQQPDNPSRPEAIRRLVEKALGE